MDRGKRKEPADGDAPLNEHVAPETAQDPRRRNGVNRQLRPDAPSQRQAASAAAAARRKERAMPETERKAKDAERNKRKRAAKKAELAAAAAVAGAVQQPCTFDAAFEQVATDAALGDVEQDDFCDWLLDMELWPDDESLGMWRGSDAYKRTKHESVISVCNCTVIQERR